MAQVRIISVDFYMNQPVASLDCMYSEFRGCSVHQVPVIRIFGTTAAGKKICLHVHGVFPYIYVPYDGKGQPNAVMYQIASMLDKAINTSLGQANSNVQHVYKILLVSGIPFYGYHKKEHQFFKLYFYNPLIIKKACALLQSDAILNKIFQPYEAHIPYILQFMIDYNLHGMSFANFSQIKYRFDSAHDSNIPPDLISPPHLAKQSFCEIEADALAQHILNQLDVSEGKLTVNPGIKALWEDEKQRRRNKGEYSQISPCLTQTRDDVPPTSSHIAFKNLLEERMKIDLNNDEEPSTSVYPAETPSSGSLLSASGVENHDVTMDNLDVSTVFDEDAQYLLKLLTSLRNNADKDSALSQVDQERDSEEEEVDLSIPLGSLQTPRKAEEIEEGENDLDDLLNDSYFDATLHIPQLDGNNEETDTGNRYNLRIRKPMNEAITYKDSLKLKSFRKRKSKSPTENNTQKFPSLELNSANSSSLNQQSFVHLLDVHQQPTTSSALIGKINRFLDGSNDNSSSDDDTDISRQLPTAKKRQRKFSSQPVAKEYAPLAVTFGSPSKSNGRGLQEMSSFTLSKNDKKGETELNARPQHGDNSQTKKHKRSLTFTEIAIVPLNQTTIEEKTICRYTSIKSTNKNQQIVDAQDLHSRVDETLKPKEIEISETKQNISQHSNNSGEYSDDIFSPASEELGLSRKEEEEQKDKSHVLDLTKTLTDDLFSSASEELGPPKEEEDKSHVTELIETLTDDLFLPASKELGPTKEEEDKSHVTELIETPLTDDLFSPASEELGPQEEEDDNSHVTELIKTLTTYDDEISTSPTAVGVLMVSVPKYNPPSRKDIESTLSDYNIPQVRYQQPFYGDPNDVTGSVEVGNNVLKIASKMDLPESESFTKGIDFYSRRAIENLAAKEKLSKKEMRTYRMTFFPDRKCIITPAILPPTRAEVEKWLRNRDDDVTDTTIIEQKCRVKVRVPKSPGGGGDDDSSDSLSISPCTPSDSTMKSVDLEAVVGGSSPVIKKNKSLIKRKKTQLQKSQVKGKRDESSCGNSGRISCATFNNTNNFALSLDNLQQAKAVIDHQYLTILAMEVFIETRGDFEPDPQLDSVRGIFYAIHQDAPNTDVLKGAFIIDALPHDSPSKRKKSILDGTGINYDVELVATEIDLINSFAAFVKKHDPEILIGYEIEMHSWGYLIDRGYVLGLNLASSLSKIPNDIMQTRGEKSTSDLKLTGRIIIDFWRLMRHEIALQSYTFENIVYHVLHQRVPLYAPKELSFWWNHRSATFRNRTINYFMFRVQAILKILDQLDLVNRTSEMARLFGIQFYEVLSRGSQFRVESMMLRLAKPLNYIPISPSVQQRAKMRAPESLPLIMEPESKFYADPVIVLDFQSLYPSMIIAYNYCFSTSLGRIEHLGQNVPFEFGAANLQISRNRLKKLLQNDLLNLSPCGVAFVKSKVRRGILPRMLQDILDTRLMVKKSMKENPNDKILQKVLHARQLGLKLIANVTYGYTAANFSGRMPAIELGDSVVSKGRETLQRAIKLVENNSKWRARVVYGDTDSLFVLVAGRSREDAFKIGKEIADAVTDDNPSPVKLKLEKVFQPCILQTKKRYVGYMYESPGQKQPEFLAKGIETVRRDGCPAISKILEKCLKLLFDTRDVSLIRKYVVRQFSKLLTGRVSIQELTFAKEYRGASGYRPGACVPALELARKWTAIDKRKEPRRGERVPYVIINGPPGLPLIRLVRSPRELLNDTSLRPNALYYITKAIIPPINRCFNLIGADLNIWFNAMPRKQIQYLPSSSPNKGKKSTISQYFATASCAICGQQSQSGLCVSCEAKPQESAILLHEKLCIWEKNHFETNLICQSCCGRSEDLVCISLDCPVLYRRAQTEKDLQQSAFVRQLIANLPEDDYY